MREELVSETREISSRHASKDYILQIRVKNGPMLRAMRACGFKNAAQLSRASGVNQSTIGCYLSLSFLPVNKKGKWRSSAIKIADCLRVLPDQLFPPQHIREVLTKNSSEVEVSLEDIDSFRLMLRSGDPQFQIDRREADKAIGAALSSLSSRQRQVLELRYGLDDGQSRSLREISEEIGVSPERIRQMELSALRRLRHPSRSQSMKSALETYTT
jgi:RNA polymerase sigma factor (sigma-70 family)